MAAKGPLAGVKVLDLSWVILGPYCTQLLADHGADVIKIESLDGDTLREFGPRHHPDMGPSFLQLNRNKQSIALDLKQAPALDVVRRLISWCDVLISNMRPQALARLGLDYAAVKAINKKVVYVSCCGFLEEGPYAGRPAFDEILQAMTGLTPHRPEPATGLPQSIPMPLADRYTGLYAAFCISSALVAAAQRQEGQKIEIPMFEVMAQLVLSDHMTGALFEPALSQPGYERYLNGTRTFFKTSDSFICATINNNQQWQRFLKAVERTDLMVVPEYASQSSRAQHAAMVDEFLRSTLRQRTTQNWLALFESIDVPATSVRSLGDLANDPHLNTVGFFLDVDHPSEGHLRMPGFPARWSETPPEYRRHAPRLGEHSREILAARGYSEAQIGALLDAKAVKATE